MAHRKNRFACSFVIFPGLAFCLLLGGTGVARAQSNRATATAASDSPLYQLYASSATPSHYRQAIAHILRISSRAAASPQSTTPQAAPSNALDVRVACNPLRLDCQPLLFQNLPAGTRLRIHTFIGTLITDLSADGAGQVAWDGTDQNGQPVGNSVYFVFAESNGATKTFQVSVKR